ncbi:hypothetical protein N431DRAFT_77478 [Stipitochalara longipes BDJ]|nr:hypothetical protein N431DRAFT_77478 [Stipitochalara longipes BDJ]
MQCLMLFLPRSCITRTFASQAKKRPSRLDSTISLDHFLQRGRALSLWRTIVRGSRRIADPNTRQETLRFTQIRYLISTGKTQWESMERYIEGL